MRYRKPLLGLAVLVGAITLLSAFQAQTRAPKWEYLSILKYGPARRATREMETDLGKWGGDGWELVNCHLLERDASDADVNCWLKRRVP